MPRIDKEVLGGVDETSPLGGQLGRAIIRKFPKDSLAAAIATKMEKRVLLVGVETLDRVAQTALWILLRLRRQGIIDRFRPAFFLKRSQNGLLAWRGNFELFHNTIAHAELTAVRVPRWYIADRYERTGGGGNIQGRPIRRKSGQIRAQGCRKQGARFGQHKTGSLGEGEVQAQVELATPITGARRFLGMFHITLAYQPAKIALCQAVGQQALNFHGKIPHLAMRVPSAGLSMRQLSSAASSCGLLTTCRSTTIPCSRFREAIFIAFHLGCLITNVSTPPACATA